MIKKYIVKDEVGLHARPASILVQEAAKFPNDIFIIYKDKQVTLKSVIGVMSLGVPHEAEFGILVEGYNPENVFEALENVLNEHSVI